MKFGEHKLNLDADESTYDFLLPRSADGSDNTVRTLTAETKDKFAAVTISDSKTFEIANGVYYPPLRSPSF